MQATVQGYGQSVLSVKSSGIDIHLPARVFGKGWATLLAQLVHGIGQRRSVVFQPRVMCERDADADAPRWKACVIDVLSWLVYWLKVPAGHELVRLWHTIDWVAINRWAAPAYTNAHGGRRAWAPAQLLALLTLMFLYGIPHETTVVRYVQENIVWCWFCGFGLFGPFPTHDALYELRKRMEPEGFERLLTLVVRACLDAGLVDNALVFFDLTAQEAAAHRWSAYERAVILSRALLRYLELVWAEQQPEQPFPDALRDLAVAVAKESLGHKKLDAVPAERVLASIEQWEQAAAGREPAWRTASDGLLAAMRSAAPAPALAALLAQGQQAGNWLKQRAQKRLAQMAHARGDAQARVGRTSNYTFFCGYLLGFVVSGAQQVITAVAWGVGNVKQYKLLAGAVDAHQQRVGKPAALAADSAFDVYPVHTYLDEEQVEGHIASHAHAAPRDGGYGTAQVTWDADAQQWRCPNGTPLRLIRQADDGTQTLGGTACAQCPLYDRCFPSGQGAPKRWSLHPQQHRRWQENRAHCQTEAYKTAQAQRFVTEGRFGLLKGNHQRSKVPYRSEAMNHIAGLLLAIVIDWRILARHTPHRR